MMHDETPARARTEQLAYRLWQEAGCPEGQADRFWREAEGLIAAAQAPGSVPPEVSARASGASPASAPVEAEPSVSRPPVIEPGWRAAAARYFAAWWAYPSKPPAR